MSDEEQTYGHPKVQRFYRYWRSKCGDGALPGRNDIDPLDIPDLLPGLILLDASRDGSRLRFRIRLAGTEICDLHRCDITGEWVDEVLGPLADPDVTRNHERIVATGEPHFWRSNLQRDDRRHIEFQRLLCPLASDGETVDMLIGYFAFEETTAAMLGRLPRFRSTPRRHE